MDRRHFLECAGMVTGASLLPKFALALDTDGDLTKLSLAEASRRIRSGQLTSSALVKALLARIDTYNSKINAYITVMRESALQQAAVLDAEAARGHLRGPLHGIPLAVKDNIDTAGTRTTVGSLLFDDRVPETDAFVITQLHRAGAVLIGKANLHELAMGGSSVTSYFGPVRNPWELDRVAGGSSGGSAAAVIADMAFGALGTDTGGSIRIPAAWCGVVGLMPTYGLVSLSGIFPLIYSLDHCGPLTRTVEDAAILLTAMVGYDEHDAASVEHPGEDYAGTMRNIVVKEMRLGVPQAPFLDNLDADVAAAFDAALQVLRRLTKSVREVALPATDALDWTAIRAAEVAAVHEDFYRRHPDSYSLQTRGVLEGTMKELNDPRQDSAGKLADLVRAERQLALLRKSVDDAFTDFDLVVLPTMRVGPRTINEELQREETPKPAEPENTSNSLAFDLYGVPAMTLPCGFSKLGLPIGLMIAGPHFSEAKVLALGNAYEQATQWHLRRPELSPTMPLPAIVRSTAPQLTR